MVLVDDFSKYIEVTKLKDLTSPETILVHMAFRQSWSLIAVRKESETFAKS